jgi:hypothetical protein
VTSQSKRERQRANKQAALASKQASVRMDRKRRLAIAGFVLAGLLFGLSFVLRR